MNLEPYPYEARAWRGGQLVARSHSCLCLAREGDQPALLFPTADVTPAGRAMLQTTSALLGPLALPASPVLPESPVLPGSAELGGYGVFDGRVRLEVVDGGADAEERDLTVKAFPTWGDAADLLDLLNVRQTGALSYTSTARSDARRPVVEGSQMLAQSMVAAGRHVPGRRVVSASMVLLRAADAGRPLQLELTELSSGRTFAGLSVQVVQGDRCCAAGTLLLDTTAPDLVRHQVDAPEVPGPYDCPPYDMGVTGRDLRVVDAAYTSDPAAPVGPPVIDAWVRFREVPEDPVLHAALLAQFTGHMSIAAALRPHQGVGQQEAHRSLSMAINAIHLSMHDEVCARDWMLYHHLSTFAGDGMTHAECRVHREDGGLLASFSVEAMVRSPTLTGQAVMDGRTAL